jgi:hypothetical protein
MVQSDTHPLLQPDAQHGHEQLDLILNSLLSKQIALNKHRKQQLLAKQQSKYCLG